MVGTPLPAKYLRVLENVILTPRTPCATQPPPRQKADTANLAANTLKPQAFMKSRPPPLPSVVPCKSPVLPLTVNLDGVTHAFDIHGSACSGSPSHARCSSSTLSIKLYINNLIHGLVGLNLTFNFIYYFIVNCPCLPMISLITPKTCAATFADYLTITT